MGRVLNNQKGPVLLSPRSISWDQKQKEKKIPNLLWFCKSWHNERGKQRGSWFCSATEVRDWWHPRRRLVQGRSSELRRAYLCNKLQLFSALAISYKVQCVEIITIRSVMGSVSYLNHIIIPYPYLLCAFFFFAMGLAVHNWFCQIDLLDHAVKMPKLNYPQVQLQFFFGGVY